MSSGITKRDIIHAIKPCWHGLEKLVKVITGQSLKAKDGPFGFSVTKEPIEHKGNVLEGKVKIVDNSDVPLSVVGSDYGLVQPAEFVDMIMNALEGIPHDIETGMTLFGRTKQVVCVNIESDVHKVKPKDEIKSHLVFMSSLNGSEPLSVIDTMTRVVCNNTLQYAKATKGSLKLSTRHTKLISNRIEGMEMVIQSILDSRKIAYAAISSLAKESISLEKADLILTGFVGSAKGRGIGQKDDMLTLFQKGIGNKGENMFDLLNGVTEYYTHSSLSDTVEDRGEKMMLSSEFGTGAKKKSEFFNLITEGDQIDTDTIEKLTANGEKLLAAHAKSKEAENLELAVIAK